MGYINGTRKQINFRAENVILNIKYLVFFSQKLKKMFHKLKFSSGIF